MTGSDPTPEPSRLARLRGLAWFALKRLILIEAIIVAMVCGLVYLFGGRGHEAYALALMVAGTFVVAFGPFSLLGGWSVTRTWGYQYANTVNPNTTVERISQEQQEHTHNYGLMLPSFVLGTLTIIISVAIQTTFA